MESELPASEFHTQPDDVEGLDNGEDSGLGDYPIDTLLIRKETRTVFDVVRRINNGGFILDPDFQRDFVWVIDKQSKLIESIVMRIPLPVFYLAEDPDGRTIVVDGLQRLSTFRNFLGNKLVLKLKHQDSLHKKKFEDLSPKLKNRIEDCNLELYIIDSKVPERAKLDIFERVNSGEILTRQQMRNCLYMGQATKWLKDESNSELFLAATGGSLDQKKMRDREFLNRFCAFFLLGVNDYTKSDMDDYLARALTLMNKQDDSDLENLSKWLSQSLTNNFTLFGRHAFRKHIPEQQSRNVINASLWDVMSTGLAKYSPEVVEEKSHQFKNGFYDLLSSPEFSDAITYSPNSTNKVLKRFTMADQLFKEVFGASPY